MISLTIRNEADNHKKIFHRKKGVEFNDLVHLENAPVFFYAIEENTERRKMMSMSLTDIYFQTKVIEFTNILMYNYGIKMLRKKIQKPLYHHEINGRFITQWLSFTSSV